MSFPHDISKLISSSWFQMTTQVFTIVGLVLAAYITARLAPVLARIDKLEFKVQAIEDRNKDVDPLIGRFILVEGKMEIFDKRLDRFEGKLDKVIDERR